MPLERENPDYQSLFEEISASDLDRVHKAVLYRMMDIAFYKIESEADRVIVDQLIEGLKYAGGSWTSGGYGNWYTHDEMSPIRRRDY